ncbi:FCD domain-containing protein [Kribbella amoyensis]|uniref:FCD domain-containing protein n=1 Tax=Kribbella amoyensis TaxID=996641 RepID=UPI0011A2227D
MERQLPVSTTIDQHRAIAEAVRAQDPQAAAAAMRKHLKQTEKDLTAALRAAI